MENDSQNVLDLLTANREAAIAASVLLVGGVIWLVNKLSRKNPGSGVGRVASRLRQKLRRG